MCVFVFCFQHIHVKSSPPLTSSSKATCVWVWQFVRHICCDWSSPPCRTPVQGWGAAARVDMAASTVCACVCASERDPAPLRNGVSQTLFPMQLQWAGVHNCRQGSPPSLQYLDILSINWLFIYVGILKIYLRFSVPTHLGTGLSTLAEKNNSDLFKVSYIEVASHKAKKIYGEKHGSSPWELIFSADLRPQGWD